MLASAPHNRHAVKPSQLDYMLTFMHLQIVLADSEVSRAAHDALLALTLTAERLIGVLATRSARNAQAGKRRTIRLDDVAAAVRADKRLVGAGLPEVSLQVTSVNE